MNQQAAAEGIVRRWMWWSVGVGFVPVPLVDITAVTALQLKMLAELSRLYHVHFSEKTGRALIASLMGGLTPPSLAFGTVGSAIKAVPVVGLLSGGLMMPIFCGASTYAVGRLFAKHLESGGSAADLDTKKMQAAFLEEFESARRQLL